MKGTIRMVDNDKCINIVLPQSLPEPRIIDGNHPNKAIFNVEYDTIELNKISHQRVLHNSDMQYFQIAKEQLCKRIDDEINKLNEKGINVYLTKPTFDLDVSYGELAVCIIAKYMIDDNDAYKWAFIDGVLDNDDWKERSMNIAQNRLRKKLEQRSRLNRTFDIFDKTGILL